MNVDRLDVAAFDGKGFVGSRSDSRAANIELKGWLIALVGDTEDHDVEVELPKELQIGFIGDARGVEHDGD